MTKSYAAVVVDYVHICTAGQGAAAARAL